MMSSYVQRLLLFFALAFVTRHSRTFTDASLTDPSSTAYEAYLDFVSTINYANQKFMGNNDQVSVFWEVDLNSETLKLVVAAACQGWVGFGISETGAMRGADMVIFEASKRELNDYYSLDYVMPMLDHCPSDWTMVQNVVTDSFIAFEAIRPLDTNDTQDFRIQNDSDIFISPTIVIAAWGDYPSLSFHGSGRAVRSTLRFYQQEPAEPTRSYNIESGKSNIDVLREAADESVKFTAKNVTVPLSSSHYELICINIEDLPGISKNDTINVIGLAQSPSLENNGVDTTGFVHHFIVMGIPGKCSDTLNPLKKVLYIWAPGQDPMLYPPKVSFPLGSNTALKGLVLEIHYSNLNLVEDVVDDTGIEMFYMKEPREFDAQVMVLGSAPGPFGIDGTPIPAGTSRHENACPESCFSMHFQNPVTVFAEGFHMHYNGVRITGQLKRDGSEIVNKASVEVWDYDQNGVRIVQQEPYQIIPGRDSYTYACYFDTPNNETLFGQDTTEEMCVAILWYYPAVKDEFLPQYCGPNFVIPQCKTNYTPAMVDENVERVFGTHDGFCDHIGNETIVECFPGSALVQVEKRGPIQLADVQLGDKVLVGNNVFEPVYSFGHYDPTSTGKFVVLKTVNNAELYLSAQHMVITNKKGAIPALLIEIGDELIDSQGKSDAVIAISNAVRRGRFAPFTSSGKLIVDGITVSNYISLQDSAFFTVGTVTTPFTHQWLAHNFMAPFRFYCSYISRCTIGLYNKEGLSTWVASPFYAFSWILRQNDFLLGICSVFILIFILLLGIFDMPGSILVLFGTGICYCLHGRCNKCN